MKRINLEYDRRLEMLNICKKTQEQVNDVDTNNKKALHKHSVIKRSGLTARCG